MDDMRWVLGLVTVLEQIAWMRLAQGEVAWAQVARYRCPAGTA
ncbi:hypothetical protein [Streptomyces sp. NPDC001678]